ncbi:MAG: hypothetical protein K0S55_2034 [Clostridia bacterium]|nr:hypothetical protein [Clostridia bacterium]
MTWKAVLSEKVFLPINKIADVFKNRNISWIIELWTPWQADIDITIDIEEQWAVESVKTLKTFKDKI